MEYCPNLESVVQLSPTGWSAILLDESYEETEPFCLDTLGHHFEGVLIITVDLGVMSIDRITRTLRTKLAMASHQVALARRSALESLCRELRDPITGILLCADVALARSNNQVVISKIREIQRLAAKVTEKLLN